MAANSGGAADKCYGGQRPGGIFEGCVLRKNVHVLFVSTLYHQICLLFCRNLPKTYRAILFFVGFGVSLPPYVIFFHQKLAS